MPTDSYISTRCHVRLYFHISLSTLWNIPINSNFKGLLSLTAPSKWVGKLSKDRVIMRSLFDGSLPNKRQKIFALDGSNPGSKFFSFLNEKRTMSDFQFNPLERNFPIYGAAERSYPVKEPIDYRLWIVELIYVYPIG